MKLFRILLQLAVIAGCFYLTNRFVEQVMVPDFTRDWPEERLQQGEDGKAYIGRDPQVYRNGIERKRNADRFAYFTLLSMMIGGVYSLKTAHGAVQQRNGVDPALSAYKRYNVKIVINRWLGMTLILFPLMLWPALVVSTGIENVVSETGSVGLTYPFGHYDKALVAAMIFPLVLLLGMGPYFALRGICRVSLIFCLFTTLSLVVTGGVLFLFDLPLWVILLITVLAALIPDFRHKYYNMWQQAAEALGFPG